MKNDKLMKFLEAISKYGSISKAANSLYVTQPYISQTVHEYEKKFGVSLIDRDVKPLQLSYAGTIMLNYLRQQENEYSSLKTQMSSLAKYAHGEIVIATNQPLGRIFFPKIMPAFIEKYPDIRTRLLEMPTYQAEKSLINGEINFFIGMPIYNKKLIYKKLSETPIYILVPKSSKLFDPSRNYPPEFPYALESIQNEKFIKIRGDSRYQEMLDHFLIDNGISINITTEVANMDIAAQLADQQIGCTFIVSQVLQQNLIRPNAHLNVYRMPTNLLGTDVGISYKKSANVIAPVKLLDELTQKYLNPIL
ncbi:LysR family transcriptional regulator [Companilactobacillus mishanensis]|uniref:LysR family transcriptional regulator n=1 Tax=Companilactobacillus mishanensis TaxID=2486008 RepID=UPI00129638DA|nr:LysR family transcriptional regulator [Companilactobacillus mishanensis]MQS89060.1 LysR family transcriptional regulator [Companilactobacillus mishanensis]